MASLKIIGGLCALVLMMAGGCAKPALVSSPASGIDASGLSSSAISGASIIPDHIALYTQGLAAFREFTPEGYIHAMDYFKRAADLAPDRCEYLLHLAQANLFLAMEQESNSEDFSVALERAATPRCGEDTPFALRLEALRSFHDLRDLQKHQSVSRTIERAVELEPAEPLNLWALRKLGVIDRGNEILRALELAPDLALIQYEIGQYWLQRRRFGEARSAFERAIERSPRHFRSYIGMANAIFGLDADENIEPLLRRAVEIAPTFLEGRIIIGNYYTDAAETELAEEQYRAALALKPDYEVAYLKLAFAYLQAGRIDDADEAARAAITINPSSYEAFYYLGNVWYERGDLNRAQMEYEQSLKIVFVFPEASYGLGTVLFEKGEYDHALEQFDKVIYYLPNHANAYYSRALIFAQRHRFQDVIGNSGEALIHYSRELNEVTSAIQKAEARGLTRKAAAERTKKDRLEELIRQATKLKTEAEAKL